MIQERRQPLCAHRYSIVIFTYLLYFIYLFILFYFILFLYLFYLFYFISIVEIKK